MTISCWPSAAFRTISASRACGKMRCSSNIARRRTGSAQKLLNACLRVNARREKGEADATLPICIVGGGATGVELSAELVHSARGLRSYGLEGFDADAVPHHPDRGGAAPASRAATKRWSSKVTQELRDIGVEVKVNTMVTRVDKDRVTMKDGTELRRDADPLGGRGARRAGSAGFQRSGALEARPGGGASHAAERDAMTGFSPSAIAVTVCCRAKSGRSRRARRRRTRWRTTC